MRWVHRIRVMMLCKEQDVLLDVVAAVREFSGVEPTVEQVEDSDRKIVSADIMKEASQNKVLKRLIAGLGGQTGTIVEQVGSRVHEEDGDWSCYLRLDKRSYLEERKMVLTDGGNCLHVKLALAAYPKRREVAQELVRRLFHLG